MESIINFLKNIIFYLDEKVIVLLILGLTILYIALLFLNRNSRLKNIIPNTIASLGIIGTFVGIYIGLVNFDITPGKMEESIPELLTGMKLAFFTSILGLGISTFLKGIVGFEKRKITKNDEVLVLLRELVKKIGENDSSILKESIIELKEVTIETNRYMVEVINDLANSNRTISKRIEDGNTKLRSEFITFREEMGKSFTSEFTKALNKSIEDLNIQLQKHLGDNFKNAVDNLVTWQENYIETITEATENLLKTKDSMKEIEGSILKITNNSEVLVETADLIKPLLSGVDTIQKSILIGNTKLEENLVSFGEISEKVMLKTELLFENVEESLEEKLESFHKTITEVQEKGQNSVEILNGVVIETSNNLSELRNNFEILGNEFESSFENILDEIKIGVEDVVKHTKVISETSKAQIDNLEDVCNRLGNTSEQVVQELAERLQESFLTADQAISESIKKVEEGLNTNLDNCLTGLVSALSSVSEKFVKDYTPLTEKLKNVVELAKAV